MSALHEVCENIYKEQGQSGVLEFISKEHPEIVWAYCEPCDDESPILEDLCLVCGSICHDLCEICEENPKEYAEGKWCAPCREDYKESEER